MRRTSLIRRSGNKKLTVLNADNNLLKKLDVRSNVKLKKLGCNNNKLTALSVSKNTKLTNLDCSSCKIKSIVQRRGSWEEKRRTQKTKTLKKIQ